VQGKLTALSKLKLDFLLSKELESNKKHKTTINKTFALANYHANCRKQILSRHFFYLDNHKIREEILRTLVIKDMSTGFYVYCKDPISDKLSYLGKVVRIHSFEIAGTFKEHKARVISFLIEKRIALINSCPKGVDKDSLSGYDDNGNPLCQLPRKHDGICLIKEWN
jgi:hypothetical protein